MVRTKLSIKEQDVQKNSKDRAIFGKKEALSMAKEVFEDYSFSKDAKGLNIREALAISNEEFFWRRIKEADLKNALKRLRALHLILDKIEEEKKIGSSSLNDSFHFQRRVVEKFSLVDIELKIRGALLTARAQAVQALIDSPALKIEKMGFYNPQTGWKVVLTLVGTDGLELITIMVPEERSQQSKDLAKGGKKSKAYYKRQKKLRQMQ